MRSQVGMPVLKAGDLVLPAQAFELELSLELYRGIAPFV